MTSNLGSEYILENNKDSHNLVMQELHHAFKPEFINRIDEIIIFNSLGQEIIYQILDKLIIEVEKRLSDKKIKLQLTDQAKKYIVDHAYDERYGARPIKRYVSRHIETLIAEAIIADQIKFNSLITIDVENDKFVLKPNN